MPTSREPRVAVYVDFDNIVISRYDQIFGRGQFHSDRVRQVTPGSDSKTAQRFATARVDLGAIIDYAASFGTIVLSRAYADWSVPAHAAYRDQLLERAVDLVQLFPTTRALKNGADIRLAVDVVEDLFRLDDITHVVIVAGDSDYIALAQRAKRLGRHVVGIGVAGSTSRSLAAACDEFADYDSMPGVTAPVPVPAEAPEARPETEPASETADAQEADAQPKRRARRAKSQPEPEADQAEEPTETAEQREQHAAGLIERALRILHQKDDEEWLHANVVKEQMRRMDPSFSEKALGHRSFSDFVRAHPEVVEMTEDGQARLLRLVELP